MLGVVSVRSHDLSIVGEHFSPCLGENIWIVAWVLDKKPERSTLLPSAKIKNKKPCQGVWVRGRNYDSCFILWIVLLRIPPSVCVLLMDSQEPGKYLEFSWTPHCWGTNMETKPSRGYTRHQSGMKGIYMPFFQSKSKMFTWREADPHPSCTPVVGSGTRAAWGTTTMNRGLSDGRFFGAFPLGLMAEVLVECSSSSRCVVFELLGWRVERGVRSVCAKRKQRQTHIYDTTKGSQLFSCTDKSWNIFLEKQQGTPHYTTLLSAKFAEPQRSVPAKLPGFCYHYNTVVVASSCCGTVKSTIPSTSNNIVLI